MPINTDVDFSLLNKEIGYWNSVSVVTNNCAIVLGCKEKMMELLSSHIGKLIFKN
jgi:hypothetical protein